MDCHKLIYKPIKISTPYEHYLERLKEKEEKEKKDSVYGQVLKYKQARYPKQFLDLLEKQINPFEYSIDQLKEIFNKNFPDYPSEIVNESIQFVFKKKARESNMIKESQYVIEDGDEYIRNGRRLVKEDFSYSFRNYEFNTPPPTDRSLYYEPSESSRGITSRGETPRKLQQFIQNSHLFNEVLEDEIKKEKIKFQNMNLIYEDDPEDLIKKSSDEKKGGYTERSVNQSFPLFRQKDIIIHPQVLDTGRSDAEELNFLLSEVAMLGEDKGQGGQTSRSMRSLYTTKLSKDNMNNIYDAQGKLKRHILRRAVTRLKRQQGYE